MTENPHSMMERHAALNTLRTIINHLRETDEDDFAEDIAGLEAVRDHLLALEGWHWLDDITQAMKQLDQLPHSIRSWVLDDILEDIA